jgi:hypothetical protein
MVPVFERSKTVHVSDRAATVIGLPWYYNFEMSVSIRRKMAQAITLLTRFKPTVLKRFPRVQKRDNGVTLDTTAFCTSLGFHEM